MVAVNTIPFKIHEGIKSDSFILDIYQESKMKETIGTYKVSIHETFKFILHPTEVFPDLVCSSYHDNTTPLDKNCHITIQFR